MRIIADGGSTKVCWAIEQNSGEWRFERTPGLNPALIGVEEMGRRIVTDLKPLLGRNTVDAVHYFGAGCTAELCPAIAEVLATALDCPVVEVGSDMLGAARGLCGSGPGIACILGTGSNSCLYDGEEIVDAVGALGFILGDEGSGASIGRRLLGDIFKRQMPEAIVEVFHRTTGLSVADVIDRVYRRESPNRFLASMMPFVAEHIDCEQVERMVVDEFLRFIDRNLLNYDDCRKLDVNFTGSIAEHFRPQLDEAMRLRGLRIGKIEANPIDGLIGYYS